MTFRARVLLGIIGSCIAVSVFAPSCDPKPKVTGFRVGDSVGWDCREGESNGWREEIVNGWDRDHSHY